jgi:hypothetical protein
LFATEGRDRLVERDCAEFVVRQILSEVIGPHRTGEIKFSSDIVPLGDILDLLEQRAPGSAWQRLQARGSFTASA